MPPETWNRQDCQLDERAWKGCRETLTKRWSFLRYYMARLAINGWYLQYHHLQTKCYEVAKYYNSDKCRAKCVIMIAVLIFLCFAFQNSVLANFDHLDTEVEHHCILRCPLQVSKYFIVTYMCMYHTLTKLLHSVIVYFCYTNMMVHYI